MLFALWLAAASAYRSSAFQITDAEELTQLRTNVHIILTHKETLEYLREPEINAAFVAQIENLRELDERLGDQNTLLQRMSTIEAPLIRCMTSMSLWLSGKSRDPVDIKAREGSTNILSVITKVIRGLFRFLKRIGRLIMRLFRFLKKIVLWPFGWSDKDPEEEEEQEEEEPDGLYDACLADVVGRTKELLELSFRRHE